MQAAAVSSQPMQNNATIVGAATQPYIVAAPPPRFLQPLGGILPTPSVPFMMMPAGFPMPPRPLFGVQQQGSGVSSSSSSGNQEPAPPGVGDLNRSGANNGDSQPQWEAKFDKFSGDRLYMPRGPGGIKILPNFLWGEFCYIFRFSYQY